MSSASIFVLKLAISLCFLAQLRLQVSCSSSAIELEGDGSYKQVFLHINNSLTNDSPALVVHCQSSKGLDFGNVSLPIRSEFNTVFLADSTGQPTYSCHFWWDPKQQEFNVYDKDIDGHCLSAAEAGPAQEVPTISCYWHVQTDGFYLGTKDTSDEKFHDW